jgi:hypothetical protein
MKNKLLIFLIFIAQFCINGCSDETNLDSVDLMELEQELIANLPNDSYFQEFIDKAIVLTEIEPKEDIDIEQLNGRFLDIASEEEFYQNIIPLFDNPEYVIENLNSFALSSMEFKETNTDINLLPLERQEYVIEASTRILLTTIIHNNSNYGSRIKGTCEARLGSDRLTCFEGALVGAASCGLLAPTLFGALGCGVFVIGADYVCNRAAERDYAICKKER